MANLTESTIALVQEYRGVPSDSLPAGLLRIICICILGGSGYGYPSWDRGLIGAARIEFWPIWLAAVLGAIRGDWVALRTRFAI